MMRGWGNPQMVALYTGRPVATIRMWAYTLRVPVVCDVRTRRILIHAGAARRYSDTQHRRGNRQLARVKA